MILLHWKAYILVSVGRINLCHAFINCKIEAVFAKKKQFKIFLPYTFITYPDTFLTLRKIKKNILGVTALNLKFWNFTNKDFYVMAI